MKNVTIFLLAFFAIQTVVAQKTTPEQYINQYGDIAIKEMQRSGVPAAITLAQGILESESGNSELAAKSNNHFGIKCKSTWEGARVYHNDDATGECFRKYETVQQSYIDHSDFLKINGRYATLFQLDPLDYVGWAKGLKKAGYATNPQYAQKLISLIERYNLNEYSKGQKTATDKETVLVDKINDQKTYNNDSGLSESESIKKVDLGYEATIEKVFYINETKVIYAPEGSSLFAIAEKYDVSLSKIYDFNDMNKKTEDILGNDQLIFLQRKRKQGAFEFHVVKLNETLIDIAQVEGVRLESLLKYNNLSQNQIPMLGEKIYLKAKQTVTPKIISKK
jgi:LysM repeat protein